jgi:hypothetical protein
MRQNFSAHPIEHVPQAPWPAGSNPNGAAIMKRREIVAKWRVHESAPNLQLASWYVKCNVPFYLAGMSEFNDLRVKNLEN